MTNEVSVVISAFVGLFFGIYSNTLSARESIDTWIETANKRDILQKAFLLSARLSDGIFGERLISIRAVAVSLALSTGFFFLCLWMAFETTPGLMGDVQWHNPSSLALVSVLLVLEYFYVTKTRLILKTIVRDRMKSWKISTFLVIDLVSTYWMFLVGLSLILTLTLFCEQIYNTSIDISVSSLVIGQVQGSKTFVKWNPYVGSDFLTVMETAATLIFEEIESKFIAFFSFELSAKTTEVSMQLKDGEFQLIPLAALPFTTLAASTLATTLWISMCYLAGLIVLSFCKWWYLLGLAAKHMINPIIVSAIAAGGALGILVYVVLKVLLS